MGGLCDALGRRGEECAAFRHRQVHPGRSHFFEAGEDLVQATYELLERAQAAEVPLLRAQICMHSKEISKYIFTTYIYIYLYIYIFTICF